MPAAGVPGRTDAPGDRFGWSAAVDVLLRACALVGLDGSGAVPLRLGENAVLLSAAGGWVARIARTVDYLPDVRKEVDVARWFEAAGVPAARLLPGLEQPLVVDGRPVTFWEAVGAGDEHGGLVDLAVILRRLHRAPVPAGLVLPAFRPFQRTRRRLDSARIGAADRAFLLDRMTDLARRFEALTFALPAGPMHGDADTTNTLRHRDGRVVLIDFEAVAFGPPEWDLVLTAMCADSYGWIRHDEYEEFARVYGFDVLSWAGYPVLRDIKELMMVSWISQNIDEDDRTRAEFERRMESLRTGEGRRGWSTF